VRNERGKMLGASGQFQSELKSTRRERERALGEHDEAHQDCIMAQTERDTTMDKMKEATRVTS
jgi:hypothetical protein